MRIHWMRALTAAAMLAAPVAAMDQLSETRAQRFRELDKNHDGVLTLEEYGGHPGNFRAMDANGDGVLSFDEFVNRYRQGNENSPPVAAAPPTAPQAAPDAFSMMDRNRNGVIERSEWRSDLAPASFARLDRNHDGVVTREEFANPLPVGSLEARFGELDQNNKGFIRRNEWRGESLPFDVVDRNGDNRITIDEYLNQPTNYGYGTTAERRFAQLDRNHDGVITRGEWRGEPLPFDAVDRNGDNRITLNEYLNQPVADQNGYGYGLSRNDLEDRFAQMDRNRDGVISPSEWRESVPFRTVDRNGDGVVTLNEYLNAPVVYEQTLGGPYDNSYVMSQFRALDRNGNGYIERHEWPYDPAEFDRLDRNADGRLSVDEYRGAQGANPTAEDEFRRLDRNGDGVISRREWNGTAQSFADYDRNGDGVISRDEFLNYKNYNY